MPSMSALTSFTDGVVVHQGDLNNLSTNIDTLCQLTTGKTAASAISTKPICKVALNSSHSVPTNFATIILWDVANVNTDNMWSAAAATQLTIQTAGWYRITAQLSWASAAAGERDSHIFVNGTADPANVTASTSITVYRTQACQVQVVAYEHLAVGGTIYAGCLQDSGGALNLVTNYGTWLTAAWDAPY